MFKKPGLILVWFLITPLVLVATGLVFYQQSKITKLLNSTPAFLLSDTQTSNQIDGQILGVHVADERPYLIANILKNRTLEPYSHYMVEVADKYGIDYRLIPAIAMKESGGGNKARSGSFNAWGFENGRTNFDSWEQAIDIVGKTLKERYIARGLNTPEEIMPIYAPPQLYTGGKWAKDVNYFLRKIQPL